MKVPASDFENSRIIWSFHMEELIYVVHGVTADVSGDTKQEDGVMVVGRGGGEFWFHWRKYEKSEAVSNRQKPVPLEIVLGSRNIQQLLINNQGEGEILITTIDPARVHQFRLSTLQLLQFIHTLVLKCSDTVGHGYSPAQWLEFCSNWNNTPFTKYCALEITVNEGRFRFPDQLLPM